MEFHVIRITRNRSGTGRGKRFDLYVLQIYNAVWPAHTVSAPIPRYHDCGRKCINRGGAMTILGQLRPDDLLGAWKLVHLLEESGGLSSGDAEYRKERIYKLMAQWRLEPDDLASPICIDIEGWEEFSSHDCGN